MYGQLEMGETRRLNRHYQSAGGRKPHRYILYDTAGEWLADTNLNFLFNHRTDVHFPKIDIPEGTYKLRWDLETKTTKPGEGKPTGLYISYVGTYARYSPGLGTKLSQQAFWAGTREIAEEWSSWPAQFQYDASAENYFMEPYTSYTSQAFIFTTRTTAVITSDPTPEPVFDITSDLIYKEGGYDGLKMFLQLSPDKDPGRNPGVDPGYFGLYVKGQIWLEKA